MSNFDWSVAITAFVAVIVLLFWLFAELRQGLRWVSQGEQKPYQEVAKTMVAAAGIALVIVASGKIVSPQHWGYEARNAVVALAISLLFSVLFMLAQVRVYESALAKNPDEEQGKLSIGGHILIYVFGIPAVVGFIVGFLYQPKVPLRPRPLPL